ncbi:MAG: hypothetical protein QOF53_3542 [Nocardioidaceae bacterium]|nr:hypothetical protein [Nocardioidaceae bacterium]
MNKPRTPAPVRRALASGLLAGLAALAGCTGPSPGADSSGDSAPRPSSGTAGTGSASATATPTVAPPPADGGCYRLTSGELTRPSSSAAPVPCTAVHTARTVFVGSRGRPEAICPGRLAAFLGGTTTARRLSRFEVVWFSPTAAESQRGARWFRCDLVAFAVRDSLLRLPGKHLHGVLDRRRALDTYGLCGTAAPGSARFGRVICGQRHSWRAVRVVGLRGRTYPGVAAVRTAGQRTCQKTAGARAGKRLRFRYGWEWPTGDQWAAGQHFGYCWVPSTS